MSFSHLQLTDWPFSVVPRPESCDYIADRDQLRGDIEDLVQVWGRRDASSIHIFWAWFGAGKTHTLYFIRNLALEEQDAFGRMRGLVPVYSEFPRAPTGFLDVYRTFSSALDFNRLADSFLELSTALASDDFNTRLRTGSNDLSNALKTLVTGTDSARIIAKQWLCGERLPVADFRRIGIGRHISSAEDAVRIFPKVVEVLAQARRSRGARVGRVIWLLDEFQRVADASPRVLREINSGLHSTFNACPSGLTLVLSFSGTPARNLPSWFSPELRDRIGVTKVMVMAPMNHASALTFVRDVLRRYRPEGHSYMDNPYFPFTQAACERIIDWISGHTELKPRSIMQAFNEVLEAADLEIEQGRCKHIKSEFAEGVLAERIAVIDKSPN